MNIAARHCLLLVAFALTAACSDVELSPEDQVLRFIESGVEAAENRDLDGLEALLDENYKDQKGYGKKQLEGLLQAYFFRHKNIYLFTRVEEIGWPAENRAVVRMYVAMAGQAISDIDRLLSLRARLYEFELILVRQDDWRLQQASWRPANIADLQ